MPPDSQQPLHHRVKSHIVRVAQVCGAWCQARRMYDVASASFILGMLFFVGYFFTVLPPIDAPYGVFIKVPSGTTVGEAARVLKQKHIINSSLVFEALVRQIGSKHGVIAGE